MDRLSNTATDAAFGTIGFLVIASVLAVVAGLSIRGFRIFLRKAGMGDSKLALQDIGIGLLLAGFLGYAGYKYFLDTTIEAKISKTHSREPAQASSELLPGDRPFSEEEFSLFLKIVNEQLPVRSDVNYTSLVLVEGNLQVGAIYHYEIDHPEALENMRSVIGDDVLRARAAQEYKENELAAGICDSFKDLNRFHSVTRRYHVDDAYIDVVYTAGECEKK